MPKRGVGRLYVSEASTSDVRDVPDAVAVVFLHGPAGGFTGSQVIDRECAMQAYRDLGRVLGH